MVNGAQVVTTTAPATLVLSAAATTIKNCIVPEDEISKKLPKEVLLRILSYLDVVSLCRCAQVSWFARLTFRYDNFKKR